MVGEGKSLDARKLKNGKNKKNQEKASKRTLETAQKKKRDFYIGNVTRNRAAIEVRKMKINILLRPSDACSSCRSIDKHPSGKKSSTNMCVRPIHAHPEPEPAILFLCDLRRRRCRSASTVTPHQCWNVCDWKTTERDHQSEAQPSVHTSKIKKTNYPTVAFTLSKRDAHPLFNLLNYSTKQDGTKERTEHPRSTSTPSLNCIKIFERNWHTSRTHDVTRTNAPIFCFHARC